MWTFASRTVGLTGPGTRGLLAAAAALACAASAFGQVKGWKVDDPSQPDPLPPGLTIPDAGDPAREQIRDFNRRKTQYERQLKAIRGQNFGLNRSAETRRAGAAKLKAFTDPAAFPAMLEVFRYQAADARAAVFDHLAALKTEQADATLAWAAVFEPAEATRAEAKSRLEKRVNDLVAASGKPRGTDGGAPLSVQSVIAEGLKTHNQRVAGAAAGLAEGLKVLDAIPMMATAAGFGNQPSGDTDAALAYIVIGRQTTFVSDLTPVVADSAVGFEPTIGVITEGTVLRVMNAFVTEYNYIIFDNINRMASAAMDGQSLGHLGRDPHRWAAFYENELKPYVQSKNAAAATATGSASSTATKPGASSARAPQAPTPLPTPPAPDARPREIK